MAMGDWFLGVLAGFVTGLLAFSFFATACFAAFAATTATFGARPAVYLFAGILCLVNLTIAMHRMHLLRNEVLMCTSISLPGATPGICVVPAIARMLMDSETCRTLCLSRLLCGGELPADAALPQQAPAAAAALHLR